MKFLDPKIDMVFKKLFGSEDHKRVTISFLNTMLEYKGDRKIESIEFMNNEQWPIHFDKKENILDLFCIDKGKRKFIIEMQNARMVSFEKRIVYYGAKAYVNQLNTAKPYSNLDPVAVVAITKQFNVFPDTESYKSIQHLVDSKTFVHSIDDFTFAFIELPKFTKKEHELVTDEDKWLFLLKEISLYDHIPEPLKKDEFQEACQLLNQFTLSDYEQAVYEKKMLDAQAEEIREKEYSAVDLKAEKARQKGREEGLEQGEAIGEAKWRLKVVKKMLLDGASTEAIADFTELTIEEVEAFKKNS